jgi:hypothetical protein
VERLAITNAGAEGVSIRRAPATGERIKIWNDGAEMVSLGEEQQAGGRAWKKVRDPDGNEGWIAAEFLVASAGESPPASPVAANLEVKPAGKPAVAGTPLIEFSGGFEPRTLRVGAELVMRLEVENRGSAPIEGFRFFTNGPWDKFTVTNVLPAGRVERGPVGTNVRVPGLTVQPGETGTVQIVASPNEAGDHEFSFIPHAGETGLLIDDSGQPPVIDATVNVIP